MVDYNISYQFRIAAVTFTAIVIRDYPLDLPSGVKINIIARGSFYTGSGEVDSSPITLK